MSFNLFSGRRKARDGLQIPLPPLQNVERSGGLAPSAAPPTQASSGGHPQHMGVPPVAHMVHQHESAPKHQHHPPQQLHTPVQVVQYNPAPIPSPMLQQHQQHQMQQLRAPPVAPPHPDTFPVPPPAREKRPTRIADLLNQDEDDYGLPMEEDEGPASSSGLTWSGFQDVRRGEHPAAIAARGGAFQLPPLSSVGTSDFSNPPSVPRSPRSNIADVFANMHFDRGSGPNSSLAPGSFSNGPVPASLPPIRLSAGTNANGATGGDDVTSATSKEYRMLYGPSSKNSTIRKKNSRSTSSTTSRVVERAALVSSLPSPRNSSPENQDPFGVAAAQSGDNYDLQARRRTSGTCGDLGLDAEPSSLGSRQRQQVKKCYVGAKKSQFCHVCRRSNNAEFASCKNLVDGSCRKVICDRCFVRYGWSWDDYVKDSSSWLCPHCSESCPPKASCHLYNRINSNRLTKKEREALIASQKGPGTSDVVLN